MITSLYFSCIAGYIRYLLVVRHPIPRYSLSIEICIVHDTWYMYIQPHTIFNDGMTCACRCNLHSQNSHKSSVSKNSTHMIFVMFIFYASILLPTRRISHIQFKATQIICGIPMKAANILGKKSLVKLKCNRV